MMTLDEIRTANINPSIAREAYEQSSTRLADALATKAGYEQKAFAVLGGYIVVAAALFTSGGAFLSFGNGGITFASPFFLAGAMFVVGAVLCLLALIDDSYGALGSHPEMWLNKGTIDGVDAALPAMLAYITHHHHGRINQSVKANAAKARKIRWGIGLGIASLFVLVVWLACLGYSPFFSSPPMSAGG